MGRFSTWILAVTLASLAILVSPGCSSAPEQPIINQFFVASRLRDNTTLASFSTVAFEPGTNGTVSSFSITSVSPEQHKMLNIKALAQAQDQAKAADAEFTKRKDAYETANIEAIRRVLDAENRKAALKGKDAEVQAAWTKFRDEGAQVSKRVYEAKRSLANQTVVAQVSVEDPRNPIDLTKYDGELVSKDVTISADVKLPDGQSAKKTMVVTMERALLKGDKDITGRWIITGIRDAATPADTKTS
jgi:hypothetical protein